MKDFDLEAAKRGAAVCTRDGRVANVLSFGSHAVSRGYPQPIVAEYITDDGFTVETFSQQGEWIAGEEFNINLMMRDDDYLERLERGEYGNHIANASNMIAPTVKEELTVDNPTCKESLPVGLTKREWFAGLAMAGIFAGRNWSKGASIPDCIDYARNAVDSPTP